MAWLAHHPDISWGWPLPSLNQLAKAPEGYLSQACIYSAPQKEPRLHLAGAVSSTTDTALARQLFSLSQTPAAAPAWSLGGRSCWICLLVNAKLCALHRASHRVGSQQIFTE